MQIITNRMWMKNVMFVIWNNCEQWNFEFDNFYGERKCEMVEAIVIRTGSLGALGIHINGTVTCLRLANIKWQIWNVQIEWEISLGKLHGNGKSDLGPEMEPYVI